LTARKGGIPHMQAVILPRELQSVALRMRPRNTTRTKPKFQILPLKAAVIQRLLATVHLLVEPVLLAQKRYNINKIPLGYQEIMDTEVRTLQPDKPPLVTITILAAMQQLAE
jgi:hypothetical protein